MEGKKTKKRSKEQPSHTSSEADDVAHRELDTMSKTGSVDAPSEANVHDDEQLPASEERRATAQAHNEEELAELTTPASLASSEEYPAAMQSYDREELDGTTKPARSAVLEHKPAASTTTERKGRLWSTSDSDTDSEAVQPHLAESERPK
jgi:hypothetical protein